MTEGMRTEKRQGCDRVFNSEGYLCLKHCHLRAGTSHGCLWPPDWGQDPEESICAVMVRAQLLGEPSFCLSVVPPALNAHRAHLIPTQADVKEVEELGPTGGEAGPAH